MRSIFKDKSNFFLFIKNENSVLPILIEKNFEQKIYFCLLKKRFIFKDKYNFSQLNVKNSRCFLSYFLKKDDWPKAVDSPLRFRNYQNSILCNSGSGSFGYVHFRVYKFSAILYLVFFFFFFFF